MACFARRSYSLCLVALVLWGCTPPATMTLAPAPLPGSAAGAAR